MNELEVKEKIIEGIKEYFKKSGVRKAVIGLSGGLDSALVCALLAEALGPNNVYGYYLPYFEREEDYADVKKIADKTGVRFKSINICNAVDVLSTAVDPQDDLGKGNIMARTRMVALYNFARKHKALVVGTDNKTESMLGYFTKFGDGAADFMPITGLYKTEVRKLSKYVGVPKSIIMKKPTDGLWLGHTDEDDFGLTYARIDTILKMFFDKQMSRKEILKKDVSPEELDRVLTFVRNSEHKRAPIPGVVVC